MVARLPGNVILRELVEGIEVTAVDPVVSAATIENNGLKSIARKVRGYAL